MDPNKSLLGGGGPPGPSPSRHQQPPAQQSVVLNLDMPPVAPPSTSSFQFPPVVNELFSGLDEEEVLQGGGGVQVVHQGPSSHGAPIHYTLVEGPAGDGYLVPSSSSAAVGTQSLTTDLLTSLVDVVDPTSSMPLVVSNQDLLDAIGRYCIIPSGVVWFAFIQL